MANSKYEKTQELKKRLYTFVLRLIEILDSLPKDSITRTIADQLVRSGTSVLGTYTHLTLVCSQELAKKRIRWVYTEELRLQTWVIEVYIEGLSSSSRKDFVNYLHHALKSSNESKVWVAILRDTKRIARIDADRLLGELEEFSKIFGSSILTLKGKRNL